MIGRVAEPKECLRGRLVGLDPRASLSVVQELGRGCENRTLADRQGMEKARRRRATAGGSVGRTRTTEESLENSSIRGSNSLSSEAFRHDGAKLVRFGDAGRLADDGCRLQGMAESMLTYSPTPLRRAALKK